MESLDHRSPSRRGACALFIALALWGLAAAAAAPASWSAADLTKHFRSEVRGVRPPVSGLEVRVLGRDEQLELRNRTGRTILVEGYDREPYLRFQSNGVVELNKRSPATYLNRDRLGLQKIPASAVPSAKPVWQRVSSDGRYSWFDHRIHIPSPNRPPPQAKGKDDPVKVFDWKVPLRAGTVRARVQGTLLYVPKLSSGGSSALPIVLGAAGGAALLVLAAVVLLRRRRGGMQPPGREKPAKEAW